MFTKVIEINIELDAITNPPPHHLLYTPSSLQSHPHYLITPTTLSPKLPYPRYIPCINIAITHSTLPQYTYNTLVIPSQYPLNTHAIPSQYPCNTHAIPSQYPCNTYANPRNTLVIPMQYPRNTLVIPMQYPRNTLVIPMQTLAIPL